MGRRFLGGRVPVRLWFPLRLVSKGRECVALVIWLDRYPIPSRAHLRRHLPAYLKYRRMLTAVLEHAELAVTPEVIERIERSVARRGPLDVPSSPGARRGPGDQDGAWRARGKRILISTGAGTKQATTLQNVRGMIEAARSDSGALPILGRRNQCEVSRGAMHRDGNPT
jgi:hypothetical protein